jgi:hypothetical protein
LRLNLTTSNLCRWFSSNISLTTANTRQWSVSRAAPLKDRTSSIHACHLLSINMWSICLWVFPSGEVQVYVWMFRCGKIVLPTTRFFDVAKFTILTLLSVLSSCRLSSPIIGLKIYFLHNFAFKSPNGIFIWYLQKWLQSCTDSA